MHPRAPPVTPRRRLPFFPGAGSSSLPPPVPTAGDFRDVLHNISAAFSKQQHHAAALHPSPDDRAAISACIRASSTHCY
uniref:Uncharacterized protein n=1 Tax=Oryza punctata TaxID=4537 RepID=A0A0E0LYK8_ORYPU